MPCLFHRQFIAREHLEGHIHVVAFEHPLSGLAERHPEVRKVCRTSSRSDSLFVIVVFF